jgi:DNA-binding transcriptional ArsR family regulator
VSRETPEDRNEPMSDYDIESVKVLSEPGQLKAITNPLRIRILGVLSGRAATITQLAHQLGQSKGALSYHVKLLEREGLVKVVGTRRIRAVEERWYGRTASRFELTPEAGPDSTTGGPAVRFLQQLIAGARETPFDAEVPQFVVSHARVRTGRAREFAERLAELAQEFKGSEEHGDTMYVFLGGVFVTEEPSL